MRRMIAAAYWPRTPKASGAIPPVSGVSGPTRVNSRRAPGGRSYLSWPEVPSSPSLASSLVSVSPLSSVATVDGARVVAPLWPPLGAAVDEGAGVGDGVGAGRGAGAVSYTHLDVYKRQVIGER